MYTAAPVCSGAKGFEIQEPNPDDASVATRIDDILESYEGHLKVKTRLHFGYPYNLNFEVDALQNLQKYSINNLGDPFVESNYGVHRYSMSGLYMLPTVD